MSGEEEDRRSLHTLQWFIAAVVLVVGLLVLVAMQIQGQDDADEYVDNLMREHGAVTTR